MSRVTTTIRGAAAPWDDEKIISFDFETSGTKPEYALQPWRVAQKKAWPTSLVAMRRAPEGPVVRGGLDPTKKMMKEILEEAIDLDCRMLGWNTPFDIAWFLAFGLEKEVMRVKWLDGMLLWRHWFIEPEYDAMNFAQRKSYGLKACVEEHLPVMAGYQEDIDFHDPDPEVRKKLHKYNLDDVIATFLLGKQWYELLQPDEQRLRAALLEADTLPLAAQATLKGMVVDQLAVADLKQHLTDVATEKLGILEPHGITEKVVRSPVQLSKLLFSPVDEGGWGLTPIKQNTSAKTGKVTNSTDKEVMHELSFVDPRAKEIKEYREALNNRKKFADTPLDAAVYNEDGKAHPEAKVFGTYSGRLTYSSSQGKGVNKCQTGFALHQMKRDGKFRDVIQAPSGYTLMEFDAAGQEFRWMAIASKDNTMLSLCQAGEDPHSYMGSQVVGYDYRQMIADVHDEVAEAKNGRQLGKVGNLSLQYRTSANKLRSVARVQYGIPMRPDEAKNIWSTYRRVYPGVVSYWDAQIQSTKRTGYVETFAGRRVQVRGNWAGDKGWSMGSTAINYRIQGTGADQKYLALAVLQPYLTKHGIYFAWDLHDGLYFYVPDHLVDKFAVEGRMVLDNLPYKQAWGFVPPIPLPWDCKVGPTWGSLKEYDYD